MSNMKDNENMIASRLRVVAVDDEPLALELLVRTIHDVRPQAQIMAFAEPGAVMDYAKENPVDVAFLDIQMCGRNGVELAGTLFEDEPYDTKKCQYTQKILSSMMDALRRAGAESVIAKRYNNLAVNMDRVDCDYYRLLSSAQEPPREYRGEFMAQYPWTEEEAASLDALVCGK